MRRLKSGRSHTHPHPKKALLLMIVTHTGAATCKESCSRTFTPLTAACWFSTAMQLLAVWSSHHVSETNTAAFEWALCLPRKDGAVACSKRALKPDRVTTLSQDPNSGRWSCPTSISYENGPTGICGLPPELRISRTLEQILRTRDKSSNEEKLAEVTLLHYELKDKFMSGL